MTDYSPVYERIDRAFEDAVRDTLEEHRASVPRESGEYADSLQLSGDGLARRLGSPLPQAAAMRLGADVGPRRGPHHGPVDGFDDAAVFVERMGERMRG